MTSRTAISPKKAKTPLLDAPVDREWINLTTATISDALDRLGINGQALGIRSLTTGDTVAGRAFTVRFVPVAAGEGSVGDFIDDVPAGAMVVLDNGGRTDVTVWGEILTRMARSNFLAGTVIHGTCRDLGLISQLGYPVFARANTMRTGKDRVRAVVSRDPVSLGSVSVAPGDLVIGDHDGVIVVPRGKEMEVLHAASAIDDAERRIIELIGGGERLEEARAKLGYHELQRADSTLSAPGTALVGATKLGRFSTATLWECAQERRVIPPAIRPISSAANVVGRARTVRCLTGSNLSIHRAVYAADPGDVLVVQTSPDTVAGYWGELLTRAAIKRRVTGLIIDGHIRDSDQIAKLGWPVHARGTCPSGTTKDEDPRGGVDIPVEIVGTTVNPGDVIVGDRDGIIAIPESQIEGLVEAAETRVAREAWITKRLNRGDRLIDLLLERQPSINE